MVEFAIVVELLRLVFVYAASEYGLWAFGWFVMVNFIHLGGYAFRRGRTGGI